ncbi:MAG: transcriptional regulator, partial [Planctomycetes bacterium]|nr:transcriptional regulator [Planctomycetota bacterium]
LQSAGRDGPQGEAKPLAPAEAARLRDAAFARLDQAVAAGWSDLGHLRADADLAPLHGDPRWALLLERLERAGTR